MRLDLAERLRCPRAHAATPLVVVTTAVAERDLRRGFAGCPVCQLEARIVDGDVVFSEAPAESPKDAVRTTMPADPWMPTLDRMIALLGLAEPGGSVLLTGRYARLATALARATDVAAVVMWSTDGIAADEHVATVRGLFAAAPFSDATFRGAALDLDASSGATEEHERSAFVADVVRSVAVAGRVVATAGLARPDGLKELARDASEWVAERQLISTPVALRRR